LGGGVLAWTTRHPCEDHAGFDCRAMVAHSSVFAASPTLAPQSLSLSSSLSLSIGDERRPSNDPGPRKTHAPREPKRISFPRGEGKIENDDDESDNDFRSSCDRAGSAAHSEGPLPEVTSLPRSLSLSSSLSFSIGDPPTKQRSAVGNAVDSMEPSELRLLGKREIENDDESDNDFDFRSDF
jgi:hypothetical protein